MQKTVHITGDITKSTYSHLVAETESLTAADTLLLKINSPGGAAFDGLAIHDFLATLPCRIEAEILGICASAATLIACAASRRAMMPGAVWMIHRSWNMVCGNAADLRAAADLLEKIDAAMVRIYAAATEAPEESITAAIATDNFMSAEQALAGKWVTEIIDLAGASPANFSSLVEEAKAAAAAGAERKFTLAELTAAVADLFRSDASKQERRAEARLATLTAERDKLAAELAAAKTAAAAAIAAQQKTEAEYAEREAAAIAAAIRDLGIPADSTPPAGDPTPSPALTQKEILRIGQEQGLQAAIDAYYH